MTTRAIGDVHPSQVITTFGPGAIVDLQTLSFIVACPSGHIDDFPWREYLHRGSTTCQMRMQLYSVGRTGTVADLMIECECERKKSSESDGEEKSKKTRRSA